MAQYGIGVSGLNAFSEAIDVTSNNISNSQTIGYKATEFVFPISFLKHKILKVWIELVWAHPE